MYSAGKDGDLRDIWRRATGEIPLEKGAFSSGTAKLMTVFGKEGLSEHDIAAITKEIAIIGKHLQEHGAKRVAIYLPNSVEFLTALFAGAFYGFTPILIPFNQPHQTLADLLQRTGADSLIAQAGSAPLADLTRSASSLRQIIWTVEKTSRHMDWSEVPEGIGGKIDVSVWHELVQDQKNGAAVLPSNADKASSVVFLWQEAAGKSAEIVEFTQQVRKHILHRPSLLKLVESGCCYWITYHCLALGAALQRFGYHLARRCLHQLIYSLLDACGPVRPRNGYHQLRRWSWR